MMQSHFSSLRAIFEQCRHAAAVAAFTGALATGSCIDAVSAKESRAETFAKFVTSRSAMSLDDLFAGLKSEEINLRRHAVMTLPELAPDDPRVIESTLAALADPNETVREGALAALMRYEGPGINTILAALTDLRHVEDYGFQSPAYNGYRTLPISISTLAFAALYYSKPQITDTLLDLYARTVSALPPEDTSAVKPDGPHSDSPTAVEGTDGVRTRILAAIRLLKQEVTPRLVEALDSQDPLLRKAALDAVLYQQLTSPEILNTLTAIVRKDPGGEGRRAAPGLADRGADGHAILMDLIADPSPDVRAVALEAFPPEDPKLTTYIVEFFNSGNDRLMSAAVDKLSRTDTRGCPDAQEPVALPPLLAGLDEKILSKIEAILFQSEDSESVDDAARIVSRLSCGNYKLRSQIATKLVIALPEASSARLNSVSRLLDGWVDSWAVSKPMLPDPAAKLAIAKSMARAATHAVDHRSVSDIVRIFQSLTLSPEEAAVSVPFAAMTIAAEDVEYWLGTDSTVRILADKGAGTALADALAQAVKPTHSRVYEIYAALKSIHPTSAAFYAWQAELADAVTSHAAVVAYCDILKREGPRPDSLEKLAQFVRYEDVSYGEEMPALNNLLTMGAAGARALGDLIRDGSVDISRRRAIVEAVAPAAADLAEIRALIRSWASSDGDPDIQAEALKTFWQFKTEPDGALALLGQVMSSPLVEVRLAAANGWRASWPTADAMFAAAFRDPSPLVQAAAVRFVPALQGGADLKMKSLRAALGSPYEEVKTAAWKTVYDMKDVAVPLLIELARGQAALPEDFFMAVRFLDNRNAELSKALEERSRSSTVSDAAGVRLFLESEKQDPLHSKQAALPSVDEIAQLKTDLASADENLAAFAARRLMGSGADPWGDKGLLASVVTELHVKKIVQDNLAAALDDLHPPGVMLTSGRSQNLPVFPWPPPPGYAIYSIPRALVTNATTTKFADVYQTIIGALASVSKNFEHGLFTGPTNGFALVARLERVKADGTPFPEPGRWVTEGSPKLNLGDLIGDLFLSRPGYFRTIVFAVTSDLQPGSDPVAKLPVPGEGVQDIPPEMAAVPFGDQHYVLALVYSFERKPGGQVQPWKDGAPSPLSHLDHAGILQMLKN